MAVTLAVIDMLIAKRVSKASFFESGELASIEFAYVDSTSGSQHEAPAATTPAPRARSVGRLVPRADSSE